MTTAPPRSPGEVGTGDVQDALRRRGITDVSVDGLTRAAYSTDASLYRVVPRAVVRPRAAEEIVALVDVARETGVPLTMRGSGTSIAGNAVGPGIVVDTRAHLGRVLSLDPEAGIAHVEPGVVHADLQRAAAPYGWRFGPDPSTHTRCTIGGMIGNNACGSRALGYGRTSDNVESLRLVAGTGEVLDTAYAGDLPSPLRMGLLELADGHLGEIRTRFGQFGRQVSGYALEQLLPEKGRRIDRLVTGSEGTLGLVLDAHVRLVREPAHRAIVVLGYADMPTAADAVPGLLALTDVRMIACEGLGSGIVDVVRARPGARVPELPPGGGWLLAEVAGETPEEVHAQAESILAAANAPSRVVVDRAEQAAVWRIREDGAGLAARSLDRPCHAGWEDSAVPPDRLGTYLREFEALMAEHDVDGIPYGHFGEGCVHVRIDFPLADATATGGGPVGYRAFVEAAADLVASHGGSLSGEHGDGRARSGLLPRMYDETALALFAGVKHVCDPDGLLNPGVLVDPDPVEDRIREAGPRRPLPRTRLRLVDDGGSLDAAVHRCTGVGKCVVSTPAGELTGTVMCPSYAATGQEKDSTRGRARLLQEMVDGRLVDQGWRSPEVHDALDLCLSCKGCASDCPTGVDMAAYKAEALHQRWKGRLRPRSHYALGQLPRWARLTAPVAPLANAALRLAPVAAAAKAAAGVDQRRSLPRFADWTLRRMAPRVERPDVWIWADSFTDHFSPAGGVAAVRLLESAGLRAAVIPQHACCGLTWISTGQLDAAGQVLGRAVDTLHAYVASGVPVIGLEPSCLATLRGEAEQLLDDPRAAEVAQGVRTLAEVLDPLAESGDWTPPDLTGTTVVAQPHCHHHAVLGWTTDERLLRRTGAALVRVGGCCGLAGNWGVEQGHHDTSVAVAEQQLLPAVRSAPPGSVVLADGFSCRTQLDDLAGVQALHLAELLAR